MADSNKPVSKNKVSFSERDKRMMYMLLSVIIIAAAYFLGFTKLQEKTAEVETENESLQVEVNRLKSMVSRQAEVEEETEKLNSKTSKIYKEFPVEVRTQNVIYQLEKAEKDISGLHISSEGFTIGQVFYQNGQFSNGDGSTTAASETTGDTGIVAKNSTISVSYHVTYDSLKKFIDFINKNTERMNISEIAFSNADGKNKLECSMTIDMYAIEGNDRKYKQPAVPYIMSGKTNITTK